MKSIVLGGCGFIGSHIVDELRDRGNHVRVFDRVHEPFREPLDDVEYHIGDINVRDDLSRALRGMDVVYHLASSTVPGASVRDPVADIHSNLVATVTLLQETVRAGVKRVVFLSSGGLVYGEPKYLPVDENHPTAPTCSYAVVKLAIENYLHCFRLEHHIEPVIIRASNPYGPRQNPRKPQGFVAAALASVLERRKLTVWGDGTVVRDYVYVGDLARSCVLAGQSEATGVFNVGSGHGLSLTEVIQSIEKFLGITLQIEYGPARFFDVSANVLDVSKAKNFFGWEPLVPLKEGLEKTWAWIGTLPA